MVRCECGVEEKCASHRHAHNTFDCIGSVTERQKRKNDARWSSFVFSFSHHYNHQHPRIRSDFKCVCCIDGAGAKTLSLLCIPFSAAPLSLSLSPSRSVHCFWMYFQWAWPLIHCISRIMQHQNVRMFWNWIECTAEKKRERKAYINACAHTRIVMKRNRGG